MRTAMYSLLAIVIAANAELASAQSNRLQLDYQSAFDNYIAWAPKTDERDWIGANQNVRNIGGWRYYAREPYLTEAPSKPEHGDAAGDGQPPNPHKHGGHR